MASKSLGVLTLDLVTKIGGFTQGLTQAERKLQGFDKRVRAVGREIGQALTVAFTAASGVAALVIRNTIEAEKIQAQLAAALKSTGHAAGLSQEQLNAMAGELQDVTSYSDDAVNSAQALLLTFTKIGGDVFPDAIKAAADMATALGTDLTSATQQLGKALNDPIKGIAALGRAGVQFSEDQKKLIEALVETGRTADAQRIILGELETQFGGSAVAARDTLGGALEALKNTVGNLLEGDTGGNGLNAAKQAVEDLNTQLSSTEVRSAFARMIEDATGELAGLVGWLIKADAIAGQMLNRADTSAAFQAYGESLAGVTEQVEDLKDEIAGLERTSAVHVGFESKDDVLARLRSDLAKKQAIVDHFHADELRREKEHAAAVAVAQASSGIPMIDGETQVIGAGDSQFEFGIAPRGGAGARTKDDVETLSDYYAELKKVADEERAQAERWKGIVAQLDGPLAEAEHAHELRLRDIEKAGKDAGATSEQIATAKLKETEAHQKNLAAIKASLNPLATLLEDMRLEHDLLGMTNAQRVAELELRRMGIEMAPAEEAAARQVIEAQAELIEQRQRAISAMDEFRSSFADNVASVLDGTKSIKDAFRDMVADLISQITRLIAQQWTEKLFGQMGTANTGAAGSGFGAIFSAIFGGPRAAGGPVMSGVPYLVGEQGKELFVPSTAGSIVSADRTASMLRGSPRSGTTIVVQGSTSRRSLDRMEIDQNRRQRRETSRTV